VGEERLSVGVVVGARRRGRGGAHGGGARSGVAGKWGGGSGKIGS
jgi:hypothetical protein